MEGRYEPHRRGIEMKIAAMARIGMMVILIFVVSACEWRTIQEDRTPFPAVSWRCPSLPQNFDEAELVGTWMSRHGSWATNELILGSS